MVARTNLLWLGELVSQLLIILVNIASILLLLPYFFGLGAEGAAFLNLVYLFFGVITLINVIAIGWQWRRTQQRLDAINADPGQWLARWHYDQWGWQEYAQRERSRRYWTIAKWSLPILLIATFVSYMWLQTLGQRILWPMLTVMGVNLLALLVQTGILPYYRILNTAPEAIITADGLCIGGSAYFWRQGNASLRALNFVAGQPNTLDFTLRIRKGRNSSTQTVRVPVPVGCEAQAETIIGMLAPK